MADKVQYKLWLEAELAASLDRAARNYRRKSGNEIAVEVLERYLTFWEQTEAAKADAFRRQLETASAPAGYLMSTGTGKPPTPEEMETGKPDVDKAQRMAKEHQAGKRKGK